MRVPQTLPGLLAARAGIATPALIERDRLVAYAQIADESRRVAAGLSQLGVAERDRVALWLPNVTAWLAVFFACAELGAIAVAVNTRFRSRELADIVTRSGCKVLVFWPGFERADFAGVLAGCEAHALSRLDHMVVYGEAGESTPDTIAGNPAVPMHCWWRPRRLADRPRTPTPVAQSSPLRERPRHPNSCST